MAAQYSMVWMYHDILNHFHAYYKHLGVSNFLLSQMMDQGTYLYKNLCIIRYFCIIISKGEIVLSMHILSIGGYFQITLPNDCTNFHFYHHITILFTEHTWALNVITFGGLLLIKSTTDCLRSENLTTYLIL